METDSSRKNSKSICSMWWAYYITVWLVGKDSASLCAGPERYPWCCRNWQWENSCIWDSYSS